MRQLLGAALLAAAFAGAQTADQKSPWKDLQFLLGKWTASGGGQPGTGQGAFSFQAELNNSIIVRHNFAEYASGSPAIARHDDLMIVYLEGAPRAIYFDSEGHVIRYAVKIPGPDAVVFESDGTQPGPRFRLSYKLEGQSLNGKFEMAEPGKTEFKPYLSWSSVKDAK
jgi:hypothetical protein